LKRPQILRWFVLSVALIALLLGASGCVCGGSVRATSWTGLTLQDGKIYVADLQQIQILGTDGELERSIPENTEDNTFGSIYVAPAVGEGYLIVASQSTARGFLSQATYPIVKLDIETGGEMWRFEKARGQYIEGGVAADGIFVIGNSDHNVYALDVDTGDLEWTFKTGHRVWATPLIVGDTVYIGSMDSNLYALRLSDGEELWKFAAKGAFASTPALRDGVLYTGTFGNRFYAIDADDGTEIWRYPDEQPGDNWFWGSPVISGDTVYAVDVKGRRKHVARQQPGRQSLCPGRRRRLQEMDGGRRGEGIRDTCGGRRRGLRSAGPRLLPRQGIGTLGGGRKVLGAMGLPTP
jgi:outer membrane protein assembly factor BamB